MNAHTATAKRITAKERISEIKNELLHKQAWIELDVLKDCPSEKYWIAKNDCELLIAKQICRFYKLDKIELV